MTSYDGRRSCDQLREVGSSCDGRWRKAVIRSDMRVIWIGCVAELCK
jgi:hypothetical protein